ncbi:MAG: hypothetical protein KGP01_05860 [Actinomycetales bacterium]|nr:hypothetical protein [Actinomycetales bacterium]
MGDLLVLPSADGALIPAGPLDVDVQGQENFRQVIRLDVVLPDRDYLAAHLHLPPKLEERGDSHSIGIWAHGLDEFPAVGHGTFGSEIAHGLDLTPEVITLNFGQRVDELLKLSHRRVGRVKPKHPDKWPGTGIHTPGLQSELLRSIRSRGIDHDRSVEQSTDTIDGWALHL